MSEQVSGQNWQTIQVIDNPRVADREVWYIEDNQAYAVELAPYYLVQENRIGKAPYETRVTIATDIDLELHPIEPGWIMRDTTSNRGTSRDLLVVLLSLRHLGEATTSEVVSAARVSLQGKWERTPAWVYAALQNWVGLGRVELIEEGETRSGHVWRALDND